MSEVIANPAEAKTLPQLLRASAAAYGDSIAISLTAETIENDSLTFQELQDRSAELARGLLARGVGKGSRVGFIFGNCPNFALWIAAIARIGAIAIPISTLIKANELVRVLRQSDIGTLVVQRSLLGHDLVARVVDAMPSLKQTENPDLRLAEAPYLRTIISYGNDLPTGIHNIRTLTDAAQSVSDEMLLAVESEVHTTDQLIEIYTSGSMALPKGVRHLHGPVLFRTHYLARMLNITAGQQRPAVMPMFWVGGFMMFLMPCIAAGATVVCTEGTSTNSRMAMGSVLADEDLERMRGPKPWWGLGMSESLGPYSYGDEFRVPGRPVCAPMDHFADGYEIRIADENNQPVGDGEIGEMQVRGYGITPSLHKLERDGYYTLDGYYHTGDMCLVEDRPQGRRIHFVGRNGDMIKTASSNVSPAEVEMELQALEGVQAAYVVGIPDAERGQLVVAAVVAQDGVTLDFAELQKTLRANLSGFKVPREYIAITRDEVPMLPSNKVARRQIEAMMIERLGRTA